MNFRQSYQVLMERLPVTAGRRAMLTTMAAVLIAAFALACGEHGKSLPSHLAQKSALELNLAGLQLHAQESYKHSAMYFEFATMQNPDFYEGHYNRARALALTSETREALRSLKIAYELNAQWVLQKLDDPDLNSIRGEPEFAAIFAEDIAVR